MCLCIDCYLRICDWFHCNVDVGCVFDIRAIDFVYYNRFCVYCFIQEIQPDDMIFFMGVVIGFVILRVVVGIVCFGIDSGNLSVSAPKVVHCFYICTCISQLCEHLFMEIAIIYRDCEF